MFRKTAFLLLVVFCFLSTIATHDALSAKKETPQLLGYSLEKGDKTILISAIRYTDDQFNLLIDDGGCTYKNICKQNGNKFICDGIDKVHVVSGIITSDRLEITKADDSKICTENMTIKGNYELFDDKKAIDNAIHKITLMPIQYDPSDDSDVYRLKDKKGEDFYLSNNNNVLVLDKFKNKWIEVEYFTFSFGPESIFGPFDFLFRVNGKNPLLVEK